MWRRLFSHFASYLLAASIALMAASPSKANDLHAAVSAGDLAAVLSFIASGGNLDPRNQSQETPLLVAVQQNHAGIAKALIDAGADINAQAANMDTPWLLAGASGRTEMIRAMIPKGPDFAIRNRYGGNALIPACERAHVETIELLLTTKIDVNHVNNLGWTCLLEIVILGDGGERHQQAAKLVLAAGADPNLADKDGVTPLAHARKSGQDEVAKLIEAAGGKM
ncbi:MAG: ankyrin repeat domain-containing protein [Aestuariivirga sp.]